MSKEFEFLKIINKTLTHPDFLGDDCAYLKEFDLVVSHDTLVEDVHFKKDYMTPFEIGQKALLANISDILASGAEPRYATISLSGQLDEKFVEEFYKGIDYTSNRYDLIIAGGDLTKSDKIVVSIAIIGSAKRRNISSRSHALKGYVVAAKGNFGTSAQGLFDLQNNINNNEDNIFIHYHKKPYLQKETSERISKIAQLPYAMMDSSDGLIDCLYQISKNSKVKIEIDYEKIPKLTSNRDFVLYGGEDYSLVVCLDEKDFNIIDGLTLIGRVSEGSGVYVDNELVEYKGFEHFEW